MSAQTIARWNAIPATRPEPIEAIDSSMKQLNHDDEGDDDDDISLVSRTPSPPPDPMNVDESLSRYDEYVRGVPREVITVETKIKSNNKGFAMLAKLGWTDGQPLGLSGDGRVDPIPFQVKRDLTGLGKINQDVRMIETTVSQRRELDSERQQKETEEQRKLREDAVARRANLQMEISSTLKAFYCSLCDKQFKNVAQYDEHTNSYAHHHKARFRDMQANQRIVPKEELEKRKEKERKREEKELRKIAKAAGIKMVAKPSTMPTAPMQASTPPMDAPPPEPKPSGFKKAGWATVTSTIADPPRAGQGSGQGSWKTADAAPPPLAPPPQPSGPPPPNPRDSYNAPSFRTGGWTSLDSTSAVPPPNCTPPNPASPPPPPPHNSIPRSSSIPRMPSDYPNSSSPPQTSTSNLTTIPPHPPHSKHVGTPASVSKPVQQQDDNRSGWQQWKRSSGKKSS